MNNSRKLFADEITNWLIYVEGFKNHNDKYPYTTSFLPDESNLMVLSYLDDCVFWYTSEELGKWFIDTLGKRFHMNFLEFAHWFMYIII